MDDGTNAATATTAELDQALDDLLAERAIRQVLARYCRGIDRHDLALVRSCYHDGATDEHGSFTGDADEYVAWVGKLLGRYAMTMHMLAAPSIERGGDVALVETYGLSFHRSRPEEADDAKLNLMTGFRFVDRFERRQGEWKIAHRVAVTEWSRVDDQPGRWPVPASLRHGTRDATDPVWWLVPELGLRRSDGAGDDPGAGTPGAGDPGARGSAGDGTTGGAGNEPAGGDAAGAARSPR